ncbi:MULTISPECIES: DMT family transporter [unclassified Rhizobium]|uniref:DMT family transporter n=1 Tax=unclassified Rhizobium TaxID=2613769 RepID=UPI00177CFA52|nr:MULTISPECIES: DMT family transporter [unclassified Rhizobium]MBD8687491.1 DMT family transporter [Rhizobium sp. CFBP 13644]MBD8691945.1 DMT family transporter [Rhizobium sp. CFBP 13717]
MKPAQLAAYLFLAVAWGFSFLLILHVVEAFGWVGAVTLRCFIASAALLVMARISKRKLDFSAGWRAFTAVGATTVAGQLIGLSYGTPIIGTAMAAILVASIPLFSMLIGQLWGLEKISLQSLLGMILGFSGIVVLVGFPAVPITSAFLVGCLAVILGCICAAFGSNYANRHLKGSGALEITIGSFLAGGILTLPLLLIVPVPGQPSFFDVAYLAGLAVFMSSLTYVTYFRLVSQIGATKAISVEFVVTVIAVIIGASVLDEPISVMQLFGTVIILSGCALVLGLYPKRSDAVILP